MKKLNHQKMKPRPITRNLSYKFGVAFSSILNALLSLCFLLSFIFVLYYEKLTIIGICQLAVIILLILLIKLIRRFLMLLLVQYIEALSASDKLIV